MDLRIVRELKKVDYDKKCSVLTCIHYAGGFCVGCSNEECDFAETVIMHD